MRLLFVPTSFSRIQWFVVAETLGNNRVDSTVIVKVAESHATMRGFELEIWPSRSADILELTLPKIPEDRVRLFVTAARVQQADVVHYVRTGDKQVFPAVVVEVEDAISPARHIGRRMK